MDNEDLGIDSSTHIRNLVLHVVAVTHPIIPGLESEMGGFLGLMISQQQQIPTLQAQGPHKGKIEEERPDVSLWLLHTCARVHTHTHTRT